MTRTPPRSPARRALARLLTIAAPASIAACLGDAPILANDATIQLAGEAARSRTGPRDSTDTTWKDDSVAVVVEMPETVTTKAPTPMRVRMHNGRSVPVQFGMTQGRSYDVVIAIVGTRADSGAVWSLLNSSLGTDVTVPAPLQAGRDTTFDFSWPGQDDMGRFVPPGRYRVKARVATRFLQRSDHWSPWKVFVVKP